MLVPVSLVGCFLVGYPPEFGLAVFSLYTNFVNQLPGFAVLAVDMGIFDNSYFIPQFLLCNCVVDLLKLFLGLLILVPVVLIAYLMVITACLVNLCPGCFNPRISRWLRSLTFLYPGHKIFCGFTGGIYESLIIIWLGLFPARRQILESQLCLALSVCPGQFRECTGPILLPIFLLYSLFQKKRTFNSRFFCGPPGEGGPKIHMVDQVQFYACSIFFVRKSATTLKKF